MREAENEQPMPDGNSPALAVDGKYPTFVLGEEEYGVEILKVREILGMMPITNVPRTPPFVKGVINLRGKVIPVIDLRLKFGMPEIEYAQETCVIVVEVDGVPMGIIVDTVREVTTSPPTRSRRRRSSARRLTPPSSAAWGRSASV